MFLCVKVVNSLASEETKKYVRYTLRYDMTIGVEYLNLISLSYFAP
jgi:ribulose bisphosphate carboxylase small subunit